MSGDLILALLIIGGIAFLVAFTCFLLIAFSGPEAIADRRSEVPSIDLGDD